jgi:hypothetical protein
MAVTGWVSPQAFVPTTKRRRGNRAGRVFRWLSADAVRLLSNKVD